jgi:hydroxymethylpyrimidine pyrophosphatase-like HAD family hydrolase
MKLSGLLDRQKSHVSFQEYKVILEEEKAQIEKLKSVVSQSDDFAQLSEKQKKRILEGEWSVGKAWSDLGKNAGFHEKYFKNIYGYLCGYSHSNYISALQVGQAQTIEKQQMLVKSIMGIGVVVMAHFAHSYASLFELASKIFSKDSAAKQVAEIWRFGTEEMAVIYDR